MASLGTVPPDVLELIAYHAAVESVVRPPSALLSLLLLNQRTHALLESAALPHLYASIFRATFDLPALHRRLPASRLTSPRLALELKRRWTVLKRLRAHPTTDTAATATRSPSHEETLWVALLLCLENDSRNLFLLRNYGQSSRWISALASRTFARHAPAPGGGLAAFLPARMHIEPRSIPKNTVEVALVVWLFWYLRGKGDLRAESAVDKERNRTMLHVFVFAAQIFDPHLQPWTLAHLPLPPPADGPSSPGSSPRSPEIDQPFLADLNPHSATVTIPYFGDNLALGKPNACWAGMMSFFARTAVWRATETEDTDEDDDGAGEGDGPSETTDDGGPAPSSPETSTASIPGRGAGSHLAPELQSSSRDSLAFDLDWERLVACREPYAVAGQERVESRTWGDDDIDARHSALSGPGSRGLGIWKVRGLFQGIWGGEFAFLDFDSYRDMLSGRDRVIYEGAFGIQPQIIRLNEQLVLRPQGRGPPMSTEQTPALNAFFPADFSYPFSRAEPTGEEATGQPGYVAVSPSEEARLRREGTVDEVERLELILSGTGHSAWGRFNLSGRIRLWDGLIYLLKDYAPESRGRWLYRGYVVGGGSMVGRWRDTFSPEIYSGYEGSFHMTRRG